MGKSGPSFNLNRFDAVLICDHDHRKCLHPVWAVWCDHGALKRRYCLVCYRHGTVVTEGVLKVWLVTRNGARRLIHRSAHGDVAIIVTTETSNT